MANDPEEIESLRRQAAFKSQLLNTIAHELSTPLTPVRLHIHYLRSHAAGLDAQQQRSLDALERNVERLYGLVKDILEVARLETDRFPVRLEPMDLAAVVEEAVGDYQDAAQDAGLAMDAQVEPGLVCAMDADRVVQVVYNVIRNAIRFTPEGGRISVKAERRGPWAEVRVTDTGTGFDPTDRARLFQPFSQLGNPVEAAFHGAGLGLYISRGIIQLHGGEMWGESTGRDQGATFGFRLPLTPKKGGAALDRPVRSERREQTFAERVRNLV